MSARLALALLLWAGCGDRNADLAIELPSDSCNVPIPAGGSILYQVSADGGSFCGGCLAVKDALPDAKATLAFLRANAPACNGVKPNASLTIAITAFSMANCPNDTASARVYCAHSAPVKTPDGTSDTVLSVVLTCDTSCVATVCKPTTCTALGKNCGTISDGCTGTLNCGICTPPLKCGGHGGSGTPNVCSQ